MHFAVLLIIFTVTSLIELALLIEVSRHIGTWGTILLVIITAIVGTSVLQRQGLSTIARIHQSLGQGIAPVETLIEGVLLIVAGAFLLTPGIITDTIGFLLFVPFLRRRIAHWVLRKFLTVATVHVYKSAHANKSGAGPGPEPSPDQRTHWGGQSQQPERKRNGQVIDGEYERVDERTQQPPQQADRDYQK